MPGRTSTRQAAVKANEAFHHEPKSGPKKGAGGKRKGSDQKGEPKPKQQKTEDEHPQPVEEGKPAEAPQTQQAEQKAAPPAANGGQQEPEKKEEPKAKEEAPKEPAPEAKAEKLSEGPAVKESEEREESLPSNILEKGIIYFFFRGRVSVDEPEGLGDVARSFIVLRPLPAGGTLTGGPIGDNQNCRLLMLPKKVLPKSGRERYMGFVEKAGATVKTIRDSFLASEDYETKTRGTQHTPAATPVAEGVYALTSTTRTSHLAYILTIPGQLNEVQTDIGLRNRGSFVISAKSPKFPGPSFAHLPKPPEYPSSVAEKFRDLRWAPMEPEFMDYANAQFLLIGESQEGLGKGGAAEEEGAKEPREEMETLEHENEVRAYPLRGDNAVFDDLGMSLKNYPKVPTIWE